jgi:hypothetical protein
MNKNEIFDLVSEKEGKYLDLVWYARSCKNLQVDGVAESRTRIEKAHPNETVNLNDSDISDWHHGFNSGMLAALRFIIDLDEEGIESAEENFPSLDT